MPKTYTVKQVADALNFSTNTVYKYLDEGRIKATRIGASGRFKIPESELGRLLGNSPTEITPPTVLTEEPIVTSFFSAPHHMHLFDWFLAITSILLGLVFVIYPLQNVTGPTPFVIFSIVKFSLIAAGIFLIGSDLLFAQKHHLAYSLRTLPLILTYLLLSYSFFTVQNYFYLSFTLIMVLFSAFPGSFTDTLIRFVLFCAALFSLPAISVAIKSPTPLVSLRLYEFISSQPIIFVAIILTITSVFLISALLLIRQKSKLVYLPLFIIGLLFLFLSALFLSRIHWTPTIIFLTTGTFAFLFPFSARIDHQLPLTRKQYIITFIWFMTVIFAGAIVITINQHSFETRELNSQTEKVNSALQVTSSFLENSAKYSGSLSQNSDLILYLQNPVKNSLALEQLSRNYFLNSTTFKRLRITDSEGSVISVYPPYNPPTNLNINISDENYFREAKTSTTSLISESIDPQNLSQPVTITIITPIFADKTFVGLLTADLDLEKLSARLNNISSVDTSSFLLINQQNVILISQNPDLIGKLIPSDSYLQNTSLNSSNLQLIANSITDGSLSFIAAFTQPTTKWTIAIETPYSTTATQNAYMSFTILLLTLFLGSGTLTASWYLKNLN